MCIRINRISPRLHPTNVYLPSVIYSFAFVHLIVKIRRKVNAGEISMLARAAWTEENSQMFPLRCCDCLQTQQQN